MLPSVLSLLIVMIGYLYGELDVYRRDQEMYDLSERFYQGKVMARLTFQRVTQGSLPNKSGQVTFNIGKVSYQTVGATIHFDVYLKGQFLLTDSKKMPNKKTSSHK